MKQKRKVYNQQFKEEAVKLSYERKSVAELASELGIRKGTLYNWRKEFEKNGSNSFPGKGNKQLTPEEAEILSLKKKLALIEEEHEILKKAISIFSKRDL